MIPMEKGFRFALKWATIALLIWVMWRILHAQQQMM
jgi:hypothetical protein